MKVLMFKGRLGNQIFQYMYYKYLIDLHPNEKIYGCYPKYQSNENYSLEIVDIFNINLPPTHKLLNSLFVFAYKLNDFFQVKLKITLPFVNSDNLNRFDAFIQDGFWQDKKFVSKSVEMPFRHFALSESNQNYLSIIESTNSVAVHIRRGDYLQTTHLYSICSKEYYDKAISEVKKRISSPYFVFFSDDVDWVRENFNEENMIIVSGNTGRNSYIDFYFMSRCSANIIANSTFSYWGAFLNIHNQLTIYPSKWYVPGIDSPNIFMNNWVML